MKLPIVKIPDEILRQKTEHITSVTPELKQLALDMLETMREAQGIGLAAPQVGHSVRLLVCGLGRVAEEDEHIPETVLFNAEIVSISKATNRSTEGCLSIPGVTGVVERATAITVRGLDIDGKTVTIAAQDLYARVLQHEIDHLDGVLFTDRLEQYRVVFYGTSEFAVPALEKLINHPQFDVVGVVTETDKQSGRGHKTNYSPVKQFALENDVLLLQPASLNVNASDSAKALHATQALGDIDKLQPHFNIVAAYGKILPKKLLDTATIASLNLHPSLLPKYRGATPIQTAIRNGDSHTGTSIIMMVPEMDAGAVLSMYKHKIEKTDTTGTLMSRLANSSGTQLIITLEEILSEKAEYWEQQHTKATFTEKITTETAKIDWSAKPEVIVNLIRAMAPKPGAWTEIEGVIVKILKAHVAEVGPLTRSDLAEVIIDELQLAGKSMVSFQDFKNGHRELAEKLQLLCKRSDLRA